MPRDSAKAEPLRWPLRGRPELLLRKTHPSTDSVCVRQGLGGWASRAGVGERRLSEPAGSAAAWLARRPLPRATGRKAINQFAIDDGGGVIRGADGNLGAGRSPPRVRAAPLARLR